MMHLYIINIERKTKCHTIQYRLKPITCQRDASSPPPKKTRPDTRLPQSRAGGQGPQLRSPDNFGRSSEAKNPKNPKKVKWDRRTDRRTDKAGCRVA